ncbi:ComF family protein [Pseudonocardia sp.]|uniref:ComF family protein n=1 Tax=Pseudonocardia sp. TaxID=60912 RepID=UPI003D0A6835
MTPAGATALLPALLDLLLPGGCGGCAAPGDAWCAGCAGRTGPPRWARGRGGPPVLAAGRYGGPLRRALLVYKERGRRDLAPVLAGLLAAALATAMPPATWPGPAWTGARGRPVRWLVPAPSRPGAARDRGGDHVLLLCHRLAALLARGGHEVAVAPALALAGGVADSVGLDAAGRAANLSGRLRAVGPGLPPPGARVLLVDDVITTGATLRACRHSLAASGVVPVAALVLCDATAGSTPRDRTGGGRDGRTSTGRAEERR